MERLEGREKKMLGQTPFEKDMFRQTFWVGVDAWREVAASSLSMYSLFLFYQEHSREDYRHRGIATLKLLQPGNDLQPVMEN